MYTHQIYRLPRTNVFSSINSPLDSLTSPADHEHPLCCCRCCRWTSAYNRHVHLYPRNDVRCTPGCCRRRAIHHTVWSRYGTRYYICIRRTGINSRAAAVAFRFRDDQYIIYIYKIIRTTAWTGSKIISINWFNLANRYCVISYISIYTYIKKKNRVCEYNKSYNLYIPEIFQPFWFVYKMRTSLCLSSVIGKRAPLTNPMSQLLSSWAGWTAAP